MPSTGSGFFDLVAEGNGGFAIEIGVGEEPDIAGNERMEIGPGAAHDRLMIVVADCVSIGEFLEE